MEWGWEDLGLGLRVERIPLEKCEYKYVPEDGEVVGVEGLKYGILGAAVRPMKRLSGLLRMAAPWVHRSSARKTLSVVMGRNKHIHYLTKLGPSSKS